MTLSRDEGVSRRERTGRATRLARRAKLEAKKCGAVLEEVRDVVLEGGREGSGGRWECGVACQSIKRITHCAGLDCIVRRAYKKASARFAFHYPSRVHWKQLPQLSIQEFIYSFEDGARVRRELSLH